MDMNDFLRRTAERGVELLYIPKFFLRFECDKFIIIVDKHTNDYINVYPKSDYDKFLIELLKEKLDAHPNY